MYQSKSPYTQEVIQSFNEHTEAELDQLIGHSKAVFEGDWRLRSTADRSHVLARAAKILRIRCEEFAALATLEMGKLLREARAEVLLSAEILEYYAENGSRFLAPRQMDVTHGTAHIESAPLGPIFCVEPWNFPYYQLARVAGPNLVAGNTLIVKHAPNVPQCALAFEALFVEAGAPKGAYTNVFISNDLAATAIADPRIRGVALTGSERAGSAVGAEAGAALKKTTMELGGSDAFIVLDDADMDVAIKLAVAGRMTNSGQVCDGAKRFILDETIADAFLERFAAELSFLRAGDPMKDATTLAPLCNEAAITNVQRQIKMATDAGAKVVLGGHRLDGAGSFLEPTLITDIEPTNPVYYQEFFAPVALIFRVKGEEAAIRLANDSPYGLGGTIISRDLERAKRIASRIDTGMVFINQPAISIPSLPFGGIKNSGFGRELADLGIGEFLNKKLVCSP